MSSIEELLERCASAFERCAAVAEWNRARIEALNATDTSVLKAAVKQAVKQAVAEEEQETSAEETKQETVVPDPPAEPTLTTPELKKELALRGIAVPPRTRRATLIELWAQHKNDPLTPVEEKPAPAEPAPAEPAKPLTAEEAKAIMTQMYTGTAEDRQMLINALASVGAKNFREVPEGKFDELLAKYKELKGLN